MRHLVTLMLAVMAHSSDAEPGIVTLRGGQTLEASNIEASWSALVCTVGGQKQAIGWQRVLDVSGQASGEAAPFLVSAEKAWRGLARLERGDFVAAEPLLEEVFPALSSQAGPTAEAVAEGLMRCRLARGSQPLALEPYLTLMLSNQVEVTSEHLDPRTGLCVALPPIWGSDAGLAPVMKSVARDGFAPWGTSGRARQLAELYAAAGKHELSGEALTRDFAPADEGVKLVQDMVHARIGDPLMRRNARAELESRLASDIPDWQRAWIHAAVGLSLLEEGDDHSARLGIVQLLHVPALYSESQPALAGLCLAESSLSLSEMGRADAAILLAGELETRFRGHAMTRHPIVRELIDTYNTLAAQASPPEEDS